MLIMMQVSIREDFNTSMGRVLWVLNDRVFSVGDKVKSRTGESLLIKGIVFPTVPKRLGEVGLIVE